MVRGGGSRGGTGGDDGGLPKKKAFVGNFHIEIKRSFGVCVFGQVPKRAG